MKNNHETLYSLAGRVMRDYIEIYLKLISDTKGLTSLSEKDVISKVQKQIILGGLSSPIKPDDATPNQVISEWERLKIIPFDVEQAITIGVYIKLRERVKSFIEDLAKLTDNFKKFDADFIVQNSHFLPILQRLANLSSKAQMKKKIGMVSDTSISKNAAQKLSGLLNLLQPGRVLKMEQLFQSIEPTLEGIVRDLVGRVLLESIVANALDNQKVKYKRESEYTSLQGVVYDFRSDFVIPNETNPLAFIEVRKSSTRHASLYAKDKMFSAINWKGKNKRLLAILVVDGPWTAQTLKVMSNVFDYVVPITRVSEMAEAVLLYINGDKSKLKWLIDFSIKPAKYT